jgi:hypothetical protein
MEYLLQCKAIKEVLGLKDKKPYKLQVSEKFLKEHGKNEIYNVKLESVETDNYLYLEIIEKDNSVKLGTTPSKKLV